MDASKLRATLENAEGVRLVPYDDATGSPIVAGSTLRGNLTVGIGHNLSEKLSDKLMNLIYEYDVANALEYAQGTFSNFEHWADARQRAIVEMIFNLGGWKFSGFRDMIAALRQGNWQAAELELRASRYFNELPTRVSRIGRLILTGED